MNNIKISVTSQAREYARKHLWGGYSDGKVIGMVQYGTGATYALMHAEKTDSYYAGSQGDMVEVLDRGTVEARIALARIGAEGGRGGRGTPKPGVAAANKLRFKNPLDL